MQFTFAPDSTSKSVFFHVYNDDGTENTSLAYNTSGVAAKYRRDASAAVAITLATLASASAAYSSGGFIHCANGLYRLDLPSGALAAGAGNVVIEMDATTDIRPESCVVSLGVNVDAVSSTSLTAIRNAIRTELATELARIDVATGTRMPQPRYR